MGNSAAGSGGASVAIGLVTAALTASVTAISVLTQWRAYREALHDHSQELEQDLQVIKYWEEWLRVRLSCAANDEHDTLRQKVRRQLDALPAYPTRQALLERVRAPPLLAKLLLTYPPRHPLTWIVRAPFYGLAVITTYVVIMVGFVVANGVLTRLAALLASPPKAEVAVVLGIIAGALLVGCVLARLLVEWLDHPTTQTSRSEPNEQET